MMPSEPCGHVGVLGVSGLEREFLEQSVAVVDFFVSLLKILVL